MRASHAQWQAVQLANVLSRVLIVEPFFAGHGLAGGGNGAWGAEGPEEVEGWESGNGATGSDGCCLSGDQLSVIND
jgi:hypothetical protein